MKTYGISFLFRLIDVRFGSTLISTGEGCGGMQLTHEPSYQVPVLDNMETTRCIYNVTFVQSSTDNLVKEVRLVPIK